MSNFEIRSVVFELELSPGVWTDVSEDVVDDQPTVEWGIPGHGPLDRMAKIGRLEFRLNNSELNSAGLLGYYSPGHPNCRAGFEVNIGVRLTLHGGPLWGEELWGTFIWGTRRVRHYGTLISAVPKPGQFGERKTACVSLDFVYDMDRHYLKYLEVVTNRRSDLAAQDAIDNMDVVPPGGTEYNQGQETFPYYGDGVRDERTPVTVLMQKVVASEFGYAYVTGAGVFVFEDRHHRTNTASEFELDNTMVDMVVDRSLDNVYNQVRISVYPREVGTSNEILYTLQRAIEIAGNDSVAFIARYSDPSSRSSRISGTDMVTPVIDTDYKFGSTEGVGVNDKNADLSVTVTFGGNSALVELENTSGVTGFVNLWQLRGKAVRLYEPTVVEVDDLTSQALYGIRPLEVLLPFQQSIFVGIDFANIILSNYAYPNYFITSVVAKAQEEVDAEVLRMVYNGEPGTRITLKEEVTGVNADYFIQSVKLTLYMAGAVEAEWSVRAGSTDVAWIIGVAGFSEIGQTTFVGA